MAIIINQITVNDERILFNIALASYELKLRNATTILSVVGTKSTQLYTFAINQDYYLDTASNRIVWIANANHPDNNTSFFTDYVYEPEPVDIPFTTEQYGRDIMLMFNTTDLTADISDNQNGDLRQITLINNLGQALRMKLSLIKGQYKIYPELGSELFNLIGNPMTNDNIELMRLYIIEALNEDPRVSEIDSVDIVADRLMGKVTILINVIPIGSHEPLNLVYDFFVDDINKNYL